MTTVTKSLSKSKDTIIERAYKRGKRSLLEDTIELGNCLIPNRESVSAGIAQVIAQGPTLVKEKQNTNSTNQNEESDTIMREDNRNEFHSGNLLLRNRSYRTKMN